MAYGAALAGLAAAVLLRWLLDPAMGDSLPLVTLFGAIAFAVGFGGYRPALLVAALGYLACAYLFIAPRGHFGLDEPRNLVGLFAYLVTASIIVGFGEALRRAQRRYRTGEEAARQQAERMRTTLASIGDGVIATDAGGRVTSLNAVAEALTGWADAEARGQPLEAVFRIVNETTRQAVENPALRALKEGVIVGLANHTVLIAKDGTERPIDDSAAPIRSGEGEVVGCVLVFRDITERHRAETENREARQQIATTLESVTDGFIRYDRDWRFVYVNAQAERINQLPRSEMLGKTPWELFPAVVGTKLEAEFRRAVAERVTVEFENYYEPYGRWYSLKGYPTADGGLTTFIRDITDRKGAEDAVRRAEEQLRAITDTVPALIAYADTDCRYLLNNRAYERWFGHPRDEITGRHMKDVLGDAAWSVVGPKVEAALAGQTVHYEAQVAYKDAGPRWIDATYVPSLKPGGDVAGVVVLVNDITEQKLAERRLVESEARYRAIGESIDYGVWVCDAAGRNTYASESFLRMVGITQEQCSDFGWGDVLHPDDAEGTIAAWQECVRTGGPWDRIHRFKGIDGRWHHVLARGVPLRNEAGRVLGWAGINLDIGRLMEAEREVARLAAESERQRRLYETVLANTPDLAYVFDLNHRFTYANRALLTMWGRTWDDAIGKNCLELGYEPWHAAMHDREIEQVVATKGPIRGEVAFTGTFGKRLYDYIFVPVLGTDGEVEAVAGTTRDVTEQKGAESDLRRLAAELSEADRRKDEFLATLAHELRNPLAPIRNGLQVLRLSGDDRSAVAKARGMMERQLAQMVHLVDDLLDVSRISRGKLELRRERIALATVLNNAVETSRPVIEACGHELAVQVPPEPVVLDADATRLGQVFANLLNNAAKYSDRGGRISLSAARQDGEVVVRVRDTGVGIPPDMLPKVFEMFTQVDRSLERSQGGLGIGLTLVKVLVELHGGSVEARSDGPGQGSEFVVRLPVEPTAVPVAGPPSESGERAGPPGTCRILVADDNVDSAASLALMLKIMGHEVRTANDGLQAVEVAAAFRPDVILLDIGMPNLNGYEACRRIREGPGEGAVLVALTGWGQDEDRRRSREAGFDHHLVKPVDPVALAKLLASLKAATA